MKTQVLQLALQRGDGGLKRGVFAGDKGGVVHGVRITLFTTPPRSQGSRASNMNNDPERVSVNPSIQTD